MARKFYLPHEIVLAVTEWPGSIVYKAQMFDHAMRNDDDPFDGFEIDGVQQLLNGRGTALQDLRDTVVFFFAQIFDNPLDYFLPDEAPKDPLNLIALCRTWGWRKRIPELPGPEFDKARSAFEAFRLEMRASLKDGLDAIAGRFAPFAAWVKSVPPGDIRWLTVVWWCREQYEPVMKHRAAMLRCTVEDVPDQKPGNVLDKYWNKDFCGPFPLSVKHERIAVKWFFDTHGPVPAEKFYEIDGADYYAEMEMRHYRRRT